MNMRRPLFKDVRVRKALAHALDRKTMIAKLMYNEYDPLSSYFRHIYASGVESPNRPLEYNLDKSRELLREAGWSQTDSEGYLLKDGKRFEFTFLEEDPNMERILTVYEEALRKLGIKVNNENVSLSTFMKRMEIYDFDMIMFRSVWDVLVDPESAFSSKEADEKAGENYSGFKNPEVDKMINEIKPIFDDKKRNDLLRRMDRIIFEAHPFVLHWGADNIRLLYWNKFGIPKNVLTRYSGFQAALVYWWYDPQKEKALREAIAQGRALPPQPAAIHVNPHGL